MRSGAKQEREDKRSGKKRGNSKKGNRRKEEKRDEKTRGDKTREEERREKTARQSTPLNQLLAGATPRPAVQCAETPKPAVLRPPWRLPGCGNVGLVAVRHQRSVLMFFLRFAMATLSGIPFSRGPQSVAGTVYVVLVSKWSGIPLWAKS